MKSLNIIIASIILAVSIIFVGLQFLADYKSSIKNQAIDGCYQASFYQAEYEKEGQQITVRETQKYIFDQCLAQKGIKLDN